jgi:acylphosphatase
VATVRRRLNVSGDVQGVFFRDSCRQEAIALGVGGWASNRPDGNVQVCLEGEEAAVEKMISWCRQGPAMARVDDVEVIEEKPEGESTFSIR